MEQSFTSTTKAFEKLHRKGKERTLQKAGSVAYKLCMRFERSQKVNAMY